MSLRAVSVMVLGPLIVAVGAVLVLTPKDILRQPVVATSVESVGSTTSVPEPATPTEADLPPPPRAAMIPLSDLAPLPEPTLGTEMLTVPESVPPPPPVDRRWIAASGGLNLRGGPGVDQRLIVSLPYGTPVEVLETSGTWARVETAEYTGWLSANFLTTEQPGGVSQ